MSESLNQVRDAQATRARLLDAATLAFAESGFDGVRVDQLARTAGVNKGMIYHYFGGKRGLYDAVVAAAGASFAAPANLEALGQWRDALAANMTTTRARLLAWDGLRSDDVAADQAVAQASHPGGGDAADLALVFVALATFPALCPQVVQSLTGLHADAPEFEERWTRLQQRLLRLIQAASSAPKERVRLHGEVRPSVR